VQNEKKRQCQVDEDNDYMSSGRDEIIAEYGRPGRRYWWQHGVCWIDLVIEMQEHIAKDPWRPHGGQWRRTTKVWKGAKWRFNM